MQGSLLSCLSVCREVFLVFWHAFPIKGGKTVTKTTKQAFTDASLSHRTIPYMEHYFSDTLTPIDVFRHFQEDAVYLLESKDEASPWSRYSFVGLHPSYRIVEQGGEFRLEKTDGVLILTASDLEACMQQATDYIDPSLPEVDLPFKGGAVGALSYDAVELFEPKLAPENAPESRIHFVYCSTIMALDQTNKELTIIYYDEHTEKEPEKRFEEAKTTVGKLQKSLQNGNSGSAMYPPLEKNTAVDFSRVQSNYSKEDFMDAVEKIKEYIVAGDVFQTVLSQRFELPTTVSGFDLYRVLRMINPSPYLFYLRLGETEVVGSSPERLVQVLDGHVEIHPIAGTRKRGQTDTEDKALEEELLADEKERAEHFMLVDLARNDVGRIASYGTVETPVLLETVRFSHVMHIISKVTGRLSPFVSPVAALQSAFPAGTVSGAPKIRAMEILKELEPTRRGMYAGAVCYMGFDGNIDSCIAIRTMLVENQTAKVQAGAGIVADSDPASEYEETQNKAAALLRTVAAAEAMFTDEKGENIHA